MVAEPESREPLIQLPHRIWRLVLACGLGVWVVAAAVTAITDDDILAPTLIIVGSFLVPVTVVAFALSRRRALTLEEVALGFLAAGTGAVVLTALLETYLLPAAAGTFLGVGIIEEGGKLAVLLAVAHHVRGRDPRDGMVLGAVVGAGFAAFESAGYALQTMLDNVDRHTVASILQTEAFRGLLAPFGHITWTALAGGALFASAASGRVRLSTRLVATLLGVTALHALWDASYGWAIMIARGVTGEGWDVVWPNAQSWYSAPTNHALLWFNVAYCALLGVVGLAGMSWLVHDWRRYGHRPSDVRA